MRKPIRCTIWILAAIAGASPTAAAQSESFDAAFAAYRQYLQRPSLYKRMLGRTKLAATADERAMRELIASYKRAEEPRDHVRYLLASLVMRSFRSNVDEATRTSWRDANRKDIDAWLWYETTRHGTTAKDARASALDDVRGRESGFLRAARLMALARNIDAPAETPELAAACGDVLAKLPRKDAEKSALLEAVARVLVYVGSEGVRDEPWKGVAATVIDELEDKRLHHRTKVALSRLLARTFETTNLGFDPRWWRGELERQPNQTGSAGRTVSFMSVQTFGTRFVYVIDASDSMLQTINKKDMGPITGPRGQGGERAEDQLDWSRIKTRFDAAREYLRVSLRGLAPEHAFASVLFGDEAKPLASTPRLIDASPKNIAKVIAELDAIQAGPRSNARPNGTLRGQTNLHGGLLAAYSLTERGSTTKGPEYVDSKAILGGCDTVFLLSDGAPTVCNWTTLDSRDPEDQAGDPETGAVHDNVPQLLFPSPYARPPYSPLIEDVERLNLFRHAEVHCIGMGEADSQLLEQIASATGGTATTVKER